ncbi:TPA: TnsA endonuclease N-terminal domain-containing protein [Pseudomonas aeruginosa]
MSSKSSVTQTRQIRPTRRSLSGVLALRGKGVAFESALERDFIHGWTLSPEVAGVVAQPAKIPFVAANGRKYHYTPDFLVEYVTATGMKPMLVEVKFRDDWKANWREYLPKWKAAWRYAKSQGWDFHIYDESRIRHQRLKNVQFLERYLYLEFKPAVGDAVLETVYLMKAVPLQYLLAKHFTGDEATGRALIFHLLANEKILFNLSLELDEMSILRVKS